MLAHLTQYIGEYWYEFCVDCLVFCLFDSQDLKANESRLRDINKVASELESEGLMAEEATMVQAQVGWCSQPLQRY